MKIPFTSERCVGCQYQKGFGCTARQQHIEPPVDCQVDELNIWLLEEAPELTLEEQREWLLRWANRRMASVQGKAIDALKHIVSLMRRPPEKDGRHHVIVGIYLEAKKALLQAREWTEEGE